MAKVERYTCDRCGRTSNDDLDSWWVVDHSRHMAAIQHLLGYQSFLAEHDAFTKTNHYCGMECAIATVGDVMRGLVL